MDSGVRRGQLIVWCTELTQNPGHAGYVCHAPYRRRLKGTHVQAQSMHQPPGVQQQAVTKATPEKGRAHHVSDGSPVRNGVILVVQQQAAQQQADLAMQNAHALALRAQILSARAVCAGRQASEQHTTASLNELARSLPRVNAPPCSRPSSA